jgi:hypothetical protein
MEKIVLKIKPYLRTIAEKISTNNITVVVAPSGIGKSIGISEFIAHINKIMVVVPTSIDVKTLYNFAKLRNPKLKIGYAYENIKKYNEASSLIYADSKYVKNLWLSFVKNGKCGISELPTVLMIDDFHKGLLNYDIIVGLWKYCGTLNETIPRLVLTSIIEQKYKYEDAAIYKVEIDENITRTIVYSNNNYSVYSPHLIPDIRKIIDDVITKYKQKNILIFVHDVNELYDFIGESIPNYKIIKIDSSFEVDVTSNPKIYITSISSMTLDKISIVIDSLMDTVVESSSGGGIRIVKKHIDKLTAYQRSSRANHLPRIIYRMSQSEFFDKLDHVRTDEIYRIPLHIPILNLLSNDVYPTLVLNRIDNIRMELLIEDLEKLGFIENKKVVTQNGKLLLRYPLGMVNFALLQKWISAQVYLNNKLSRLPIFPCIVALSLIDSYGQSYLKYPKKESKSNYQLALNRHITRYFDQFRGESDLSTYINMWNSLMSYTGGMEYLDSEVKEWCERNSINYIKIEEVLYIINKCLNLARKKYNIVVGPFTSKGLIDNIRPLTNNLYETARLTKNDGNNIIYMNDQFKIRYKLDNYSINKLKLNPPPYIIILNKRKIEDQNIITIALDIPRVKEKLEKKSGLDAALAALKI